MALLGAAVGCGDRVVDEPRTIALRQLPACPVPSPAPLVDLEAFGDFPAGPLSGESPTRTGQQLLFPETTRAIVARTTGDGFFGWSATPAEGDTRVLLWPAARPCLLADAGTYPGPGAGRALAWHPEQSLLLVAGGDAGQTSAVVGALVFDARSGDAELVDAAARHVLLEPRAFAAAAPFGDDFVVTGGEDPLVDARRRPRPVRDTAEVFSSAERRFLPEAIELRTPRTRHRAGVLPSGEVLLVGGRTEEGSLVTALEAIDPRTRRSSLGGLAHLERGRSDFELVALEGGGWLVAGGLGDGGEPVRDVEWLSADASTHLGTGGPLPPAFELTAAPLPGGGALVVLGCGPDDGAGATPDCAPCAQGCLPSPRAFWLRAGEEPEPVALDVPTPRPFLLAAAGGAAWLLTGDGEIPWLRFNPWRGRFEPTAARWGAPERVVDRPVALDAGAFVWIDEAPAPRLVGVRTGVRHRYSRDLGLLQLTDPLDGAWPLHLCPERLGGARFEGRRLELGPEPVWLTDVDFEDLTVELVASGPLPVVRLSAVGSAASASWTFGAGEHPWPDGEGPFRLVRKESRVLLERGATRAVFDDGPSGRVRVAFSSTPAGSDEPARVTALSVTRSASVTR